MQKIDYIIDSKLTKEAARLGLEDQRIVAAYYKNQQNTISVVHSHPYHEIILPVAGSEVMYSIAGGLYKVCPGELIYIPAEVYHSGCYNITGNISERLVVQIDDGIWQEAARQFRGMPQSWMLNFVILNKEAVDKWNIRELLEHMTFGVQLEQRYKDIIYTARTAELMALISQITATEQILVPETANSLVMNAVSYLQKHYHEPDLTVTKLAAKTFTSREHLSRVFREYTMESVHGYLTNLRMQKCRRMLALGKTVSEACSESGFSNYTSFLKAFRKLYGITPAQYRTQVQHMKTAK